MQPGMAGLMCRHDGQVVLENVQRPTRNAQRSEALLLDECSFQSRLKAGLERPRMQWALVGAKRLECGSLLPLSFYARKTCLSPCRVIRKTAFAYSAFFVVTTNQTIGRSFPNPLGSMTLFRPDRKSRRLTRPRHPKIHSDESSARVGSMIITSTTKCTKHAKTFLW